MKLIHTTLALGLLFGIVPATASPPRLSPLQPLSELGAFDEKEDPFEQLNQEYLDAHQTWQEQLRAASKDERRSLRAADPVNEYWETFVSLSEGGHGQAKFWLCDHVLDRKLKTKERSALLAPLFQSLVAQQSGAEWFAEVLPLIHRHRRTLGTNVARELYGDVLKTCEVDEPRAAALYYETRLFKVRKGAQPEPQIAANFDRILAEFPDTTWAAKVRASRAGELSAVGAMAPEFTGKSIDDFEFNLSDYKGKVVLLDFYGFW